MPNVVKGSKQERMVVVPHRPGRAFAFAVAAVLAALGAIVGGGYWGYSQGAAVQAAEARRLAEIDVAFAAVTDENEALRRAIALAERQGQVDQQAAREVGDDLAALQARVAELEADVAYYRQVVHEQTDSTGLMLSRFDLAPGSTQNTKRYKLVLRQQDADGDTYLVGYVGVTLVGRSEGRELRLPLKDVSREQDEVDIRLRFKYFQNVEGEIVVPTGFEPAKIEVSAVAVSPVAKRVDQEFPWGN